VGTISYFRRVMKLEGLIQKTGPAIRSSALRGQKTYKNITHPTVIWAPRREGRATGGCREGKEKKKIRGRERGGERGTYEVDALGSFGLGPYGH